MSLPSALRLIGDVGSRGTDRWPDRAEGGHGRGILVRVAAGDHCGGTAFQEATGNAFTDAAIPAGDQSHLVAKIEALHEGLRRSLGELLRVRQVRHPWLGAVDADIN